MTTFHLGLETQVGAAPIASTLGLAGDTLSSRIAAYENSAEHNTSLYAEFTRRAWEIPLLREHRAWVEENQWGFGERAFHYLWLLITDHIAKSSTEPSFLEIGVYKGQVCSLVALCAQELGAPINIWAISPFSGNKPTSRAIRLIRRALQPSYRRARHEGNLYDQSDYLEDCKAIFDRFDLNFKEVTAIRGYSSDPAVWKRVEPRRFSVVYIDGDHSLEGATQDIQRYCPQIECGGLLVMDDASCGLPGTGYRKGHVEVSKAAEIIPSLGFKNVLNVGHNRVYLRTA